ncbi:ADP-glyceromanno-heptose 6-epimerase [Phenylobacterium montanum]|uniref:ADP-L-glycero-D-manno-heptose-6-epimerase n=1 Tax=Phenylobacterium montanum TaxID=2823693 RepID=A0A975G234_9CAUL|nr:ADP-glyceromanno-heptose 6-epimerase [Caulobacter sp. S6]QUD89082.1 ADP-glyceromanno-heptose 6-epimerase [Caulobacter sp. S6]
MTRRLVLVTGGAGFIGSNIVADLAGDNNFEVAVCDRLRNADDGKWRNIAKHPIVDFVAPHEIFPWLYRNADRLLAVVHMGAISSTTEPDADHIIHTNFGLSRDLFRWCAEHRQRFIYASSAATYGDGSLGFVDRDDPDSLAALRPLNAYGWSKALFDTFAAREAAAGRHPAQWVGLKFFNVYGPNEEHKRSMRSIASQIWPNIQNNVQVKLFKSYRSEYPDGGQLRDFVYVRDAVSVIRWLINTPEVNGIYNLGSGTSRTFVALAEAAFKAAGKIPDIVYTDMPVSIRDKYQYFTQARMEKLYQAGYSGNSTSLEDGIYDYCKNYLNNADPYR